MVQVQSYPSLRELPNVAKLIKTPWKLKTLAYILFLIALILLRWILSPRVYEIRPENPLKPLVKTAHAQNLNSDPESGLKRRNTPKVSSLPPAEAVQMLMECENRDRKADLVIMDRNHKESAGILMFQFATMEYYAKRYGLRTELTKDDWLNPSLQRETAIRMVQEDRNNLRHWFQCSKKLNLI